MMKTYYKLFCTFMLTGFLTGCADKLDLVPVSDITSSGFWQNEDDCKAYLTGIYDQLRDNVGDDDGDRDYDDAITYNTTLYFEDRSGSFAPGDIGPVSEAWSQSLNASNAPNWDAWYNIVYHCNLLLREAENIEFREEADKNQLKAEAYFLRAFAYFSLSRIWGEVPLELTPIEGPEVELKGRAPLEEVFAQINADVEQSLGLFPEKGFDNKNRASWPAAQALKADVKMWTGKVLGGGQADFEAALQAIEEVAAAGATLLDGPDKLANYRNLLSSGNKKNDEIVFSIFFDYQEQDEMYATNLASVAQNVRGADNFDELPVTEANRARAVYAPSEKLRDLLEEYPDDVRNEIVIIDAVDGTDTLLTCFNKFRGSVYDDRYFDDDIIIYRWGGLLLLKAEALAALNRPAEAVAELNKIRSRAGAPLYTGAMDQQTVERAILDERWRELVAELKRWPDLVRFHHGGTINIYDEVPNLNGKDGYPLYFPIHQSVLDNNDLLTQTEGY